LAPDIGNGRIVAGPRELESAFKGRRSMGHSEIVQETAPNSEALFRSRNRNKHPERAFTFFTTRT
jgi:hypothetical protein